MLVALALLGRTATAQPALPRAPAPPDRQEPLANLALDAVWLLEPLEVASGAGSLLRAELTAAGFSVTERTVSAEEVEAVCAFARDAGVLAAVIPDAAGDRAAADIRLFPLADVAEERTRVDLGSLPGRSDGEVTRLLGTLAVRVSELLRARATRARLVPLRPPPPPPPAPSANAPAVSAPSGPPERRELRLELGVASGQSLVPVGAGFGPALRFAIRWPSRLRVRAGLIGLASGTRVSGAAGSARIADTLGLIDVGAELRGARLSLEAFVGAGLEHTLAFGDAQPPYGQRTDQAFGGVVTAGLGAACRLSRRLALALDLQAFRTFPQPVVFLDTSAAARPPAIATFLSLSLRLVL